MKSVSVSYWELSTKRPVCGAVVIETSRDSYVAYMRHACKVTFTAIVQFPENC